MFLLSKRHRGNGVSRNTLTDAAGAADKNNNRLKWITRTTDKRRSINRPWSRCLITQVKITSCRVQCGCMYMHYYMDYTVILYRTTRLVINPDRPDPFSSRRASLWQQYCIFVLSIAFKFLYFRLFMFANNYYSEQLNSRLWWDPKFWTLSMVHPLRQWKQHAYIHF